MLWRKLEVFFLRLILIFFPEEKPQPKISLLIPFSSKDPVRKRNFKWLLKYWERELPDAEVVIGKSHSKIFCKGEALNNAARKATGKVLVILDADAYLSGKVIERCANRILEEQANGNNLWYVPYRNLYRLRRYITNDILASDPANPLRLPYPLPRHYAEDNGDRSKYGHRFGAMIMMFPREALTTLGCFDERFKGWGGEDVALLRALDTLWGKHKTTKNDILHLWHPFIGADYKTRVWKGQPRANSNGRLAMRYHRATRHPLRMRKLVDEGCAYKNAREYFEDETLD